MAIARFHHPKVIYIAIAIQIQVGNHILIRVQNLLKLLRCARLCKCSSYRLQVKIQTDVRRKRTYLHGSRSSRLSGHFDRSGGVLGSNAHILGRNRVTNRRRCFGYGNDSSKATRAQ